MTNKPSFSIAIQAGGNSSRMGQDKGLIQFLGKPLILYVYEQIQSLSGDIFFIANNPAYLDLGVPVFTDVLPGNGALGGLYSALYHARQEYCLVLACDMPLINLELLNYMHAFVGDFDAVIPKLAESEYAEPFRAFYRKTCLEPIREQLQAKRLKVSSFFPQVNIRYIEGEEIKHFDSDLNSFLNVNTPEELAFAEVAAGSFKQINPKEKKDK